MNRILVVQHEKHEGPGLIAEWAEARSIALDIIFSPEQVLPQTLEPYLGIILLGGNMNVIDSPKLPWLQRETQWLSECIGNKYRCFGICLGAQLLASSLGAEVVRMDTEEEGLAPIYWREVPDHLGSLPSISNAIHAHRYRFDIPEGALLLAGSEQCIQQVFLWQKQVLGVQCHLEWTASMARSIFPGHQAFATLDQSELESTRLVLFQLLDKHFLSCV